MHNTECLPRNLSSVSDDLEDTSGPKPPFYAVVHGENETCATFSVDLSPFFLALGPIASDGPPDHVAPTWFDVSISQTSIILGGFLVSSIE